MLIERSLHSLRDIEGVYGSFIVSPTGQISARDLPAVFDDQTLAQAGERVVLLWAVLSEQGAPEYSLLEFAEYSLFVRGLSPRAELAAAQWAGCLCVVVPPTVNLLALRLASKWVARSIDREPDALAASA